MPLRAPAIRIAPLAGQRNRISNAPPVVPHHRHLAHPRAASTLARSQTRHLRGLRPSRRAMMLSTRLASRTATGHIWNAPTPSARPPAAPFCDSTARTANSVGTSFLRAILGCEQRARFPPASYRGSCHAAVTRAPPLRAGWCYFFAGFMFHCPESAVCQSLILPCPTCRGGCLPTRLATAASAMELPQVALKVLLGAVIRRAPEPWSRRTRFKHRWEGPPEVLVLAYISRASADREKLPRTRILVLGCYG